MSSLDVIKDQLMNHRVNGKTMQRYGYNGASGGGGCFAAGPEYLESALVRNAPYFFFVSHGDGCDYTLEQLASRKKMYERTKTYTQDILTYRDTPRSRAWYEFLMSGESPWRGLHESIAEKDIDFINTGGVIFKDLRKLPGKLWYNFQMAVRFPWEIAPAFSTYCLLAESGVPRPEALYIANCFELSEGATSLEGPWIIQYPWSFLEGMTLEAAGRFILGKPGCVKPVVNGGAYTAKTSNVSSLWAVNKDANKYIEQANELTKENDLNLSRIRSLVAEAVAEQEKSF